MRTKKRTNMTALNYAHLKAKIVTIFTPKLVRYNYSSLHSQPKSETNESIFRHHVKKTSHSMDREMLTSLRIIQKTTFVFELHKVRKIFSGFDFMNEAFLKAFWKVSIIFYDAFDECHSLGEEVESFKTTLKKTRWLAWNDLLHFQVFQKSSK